VLVEGDDFNEPIPDAVKGITDGHLWLSRALANRGHFPAIDMLQSISRVRGDVADTDHVRCARRLLSLLAVYQEIEDLVSIGAYVPGISAENDLAVQARPRIVQYLQQEAATPCTMEQAKKQLVELNAWVDQVEKVLKAQGAKPATRTPSTAGAPK
jgi:flagellum-specific ATP synthase